MVSIEDLKLPPHNIDAEKGILSGILIDNNMIDIADNVNLVAKDFYSKEHQMIFEMILNLKNAHNTIDAVTVADELQKKDYLDVIGGIDYLYDLSGFLLSTSGVAEYAQIVKEKSILRRVL